jgi:dihydropteroate synthase
MPNSPLPPIPSRVAPLLGAPSLAPPWPAPREARVRLMGIVNVTPDSFSDGGRFDALEAALSHARALEAEGAEILDIGGESTRPGAAEVSAQAERARVEPVIAALAQENARRVISIDTYKADVARAACAAGARIINDVWGLQRDADMAHVAAEFGAGVVIMHNRRERDENLDIVADMEAFFARSLALADKAGVARDRIALDPGVGFGKTFEQNLAAIRAIPHLKATFGCAVLLGVSRKSFLGLITGRAVNERLAATLAADCYGVLAGADVLRVHDVAAHRDGAMVLAALAPSR